ncbi:hypothetical protein BKA81DRAFT_380528 [Phyllosticta paracitricarpa]
MEDREVHHVGRGCPPHPPRLSGEKSDVVTQNARCASAGCSARVQTQLHRSTMNWTGGRLQRHSGPAKGYGELTHRQRLHFAKARTRIHHGPPNPQNFVPRSSNFFCSDPANAHRTPLSTKRPRTFHQHETAATRAHQRSFAKRSKPAHQAMNTFDVAEEDPPCVPQDRSRRNAIHPLAMQTAQAKNLQIDQRNDNDKAHNQLGPLGNMSLDSSSARLKAEKTRLLESRDWVGLATSRPLHLAFASGKEKDAIGKRCKVKRQKRPSHVESNNFHAKIVKRAQERLDDGPYMSGAIPDDDDIRIRIGTDALATQSFADKNELHGMNCSAVSSDEMLFDVEARRETIQYQDDKFRGHDVKTRSSRDEHANVPYAAGQCGADHFPFDDIQPNDSEAPLANVDRLLQQLEKTPSRFTVQHENDSCAAHAVTHLHASPHELETDKVNYRGMHDDNVTMQSPDHETFEKLHSARQGSGQGVSNSVTIQSTFSPLSVHIAGRFTPCVLDLEETKAIPEEDNAVRSGGSLALPLLHKTISDTEPAHLLDDRAWRTFVHVNSDMADQDLDMHQSYWGHEGAHDGTGLHTCEIDESYHVRSGGIPIITESAARPIGDGGSMHSGELEQEYHPTLRNVEGAAADDAKGASSSNVHLQMSVPSAVAAAAKTGFPAATCHQTEATAKNAPWRTGMISDAEVDAAETIWKRFVLGSDQCEAEHGECKSPERGLRSTEASTRVSKGGSFSSLSVEASLSSASASAPFQPLEACTRSAVDKHHERAEKAAARAVLEDCTDQLPISMAVEWPGDTTADSSSSNNWPDTLDDAEDPASSNADFQSNQAVAGESIGQLPGGIRGQGQRIFFTKPKPFAGTTATSTPGSVQAGQGSWKTGSASKIGPLRVQRNEEWSLSRIARSFKNLTEIESVED